MGKPSVTLEHELDASVGRPSQSTARRVFGTSRLRTEDVRNGCRRKGDGGFSGR